MFQRDAILTAQLQTFLGNWKTATQ